VLPDALAVPLACQSSVGALLELSSAGMMDESRDGGHAVHNSRHWQPTANSQQPAARPPAQTARESATPWRAGGSCRAGGPFAGGGSITGIGRSGALASLQGPGTALSWVRAPK
jgi:hypothetical protein